MKTLKQILDESDYTNPKSPGDKAFVDKHVVQKTDYPHTPKGGSNDEVFSGSKQKQHAHLADPKPGEDEEVYEKTLSKGEARKKETIVKGMKKNTSDFVKRYGKDADSVMHATAAKMAKEDELAFEAHSLVGHFHTDEIQPHESGYYNHTLANGDEVEVDLETASILRDVHDSLNEKNVEEFEQALATLHGYNQMIEFADSIRVGD
jgi:hypothetical protein